MNVATGLLQQLGFSEYEARAYVALLQRNPLNGYELAKVSGVPRPNIYGVLQKLEERNAIIRLDTAAGTRYTPVSPDELTQALGSRFAHTLDAARSSLEEVASPAEQDYVLNIQGHAAVLEHATTLIHAAQQRLTLAVWQPEAQALAEPMARAEDRGVTVKTLCLQACSQECGGCQGDIYRYRVAAERQSRWLIVVQDSAEMLIGDIGAGGSVAVRTRQVSLIEMAAWYIRHSIALSAVLSDLDGRLEPLLSPDTRLLLQSIGPDGDWLGYMLRLLKGGQPSS